MPFSNSPDPRNAHPFEPRYDWVSPAHVLFGWDRRFDLAGLIRDEVRRVFVITGSRRLNSNGYSQEILLALNDAGIETKPLANIGREPLVEDVDKAAEKIRGFNPGPGDAVLGIGGGSAIDLAKAVAAMATNRAGASVQDYLEGVGKGLQLTEPPLPVIAMPTTSGTGSEATKNAVISSQDPPFKKSLRASSMVPRWVVIDPEASMLLPLRQTAESGMDAITQLIESYLSKRATPMTDMICLQGLRYALEAIPRFTYDCTEEDLRDGRAKMAHAAFLSGLALANSGLGMAHGVAAALGVHAWVGHGRACALMLPIALETNRSVTLEKMAILGSLVTSRPSGGPTQIIDNFIGEIRKTNELLGLPARLSEVNVTRELLPDIVQSSRGNSMNGNPRELSDDELFAILEANL
ncbi:MAG: alcohol dehydrogenase [Planctomyces sp.]|nr:alcohol dehydrogenase [Planctomyces sp.]